MKEFKCEEITKNIIGAAMNSSKLFSGSDVSKAYNPNFKIL